MGKFTGLLLVLVVAGFLVPVFLLNRTQITEARYAQIEIGITQCEVEAILGVPPGDYHHTGVPYPTGNNGAMNWNGSVRTESWWGDEGYIKVGFAESGQVSWKWFDPCIRSRCALERWWFALTAKP
jgi:hypothetical protein